VSQTSIEDWVIDVRQEYPDLPDELNLEIERRELKKLQPWLERVREYKDRYDEIPDEEIPREIQDMPGESQVVPVMMMVDSMTKEQVEAWHRLFSCVAAQLADIAYGYWQAHGQGEESKLTMIDVLDYLPLVFLIVLGNYDGNRYGGENDNEDNYTGSHGGEFAAEEGRTRLITYLQLQAKYHIRTYVQTIAYAVDRGASYMHRLRGKIKSIKNREYVESGQEPTTSEIVDEVAEDTHYGRTVSEDRLQEKVQELDGSYQVRSTNAPVGGQDGDEDESMTLGSMIPSNNHDERNAQIDAVEYILRRTDEGSTLQDACLKILTTTEELTPPEQHAF
jgi:hypothetical protein